MCLCACSVREKLQEAFPAIDQVVCELESQSPPLILLKTRGFLFFLGNGGSGGSGGGGKVLPVDLSRLLLEKEGKTGCIILAGNTVLCTVFQNVTMGIIWEIYIVSPWGL
uniref:Uncharacterized protein n=1 Tax=Tanacetum cinerariifolium TaxID=118510 RepID=A0A699QLE6_TANCI|nr:hypothetical protein [Tanacetum cinerariifolium]